MPTQLPQRPPLAVRLWLFRRLRGAGGTGSAPAHVMNIGSLEHLMRNRVRMFLRHTWLVTILGTIVMAAAVAAGFYYANEADRMRIAAGPPDGKFLAALSAQIARGHADISMAAIATPGAKEAAQAMSKGKADLAVLPSNLDDGLNWPVVAILRQNVMALIVPPAGAASAAKPDRNAAAAKPTSSASKSKTASSAKAAKATKGDKTSDKTSDKKNAKKSATSDDSDSDDSDFGKVTQLNGKRIGIITGNEATRGLLELVLSHYGVALDKVTMSDIAPDKVADAIKNKQVDVLFVAGAATGRAISDAVAATTVDAKAPSFIEIDQADGIAKRHPAFDSVDIDAGTFGGNPPSPDASLKTLSFAEYLVARKSFSSSVIGALAKVIYSSRLVLAAAAEGDIRIAAPSTDKDADVAVHPGALAYLSDNQQSFFDKYGDEIFYGMLIFPVFGSAIAGLASYLRRNTRTRRLRLLQRVLDLVRKAHAAQTLEAIDHIQVEADNLVISIIHQGEHEEFDETVRMSFAFALDQLRFALGARRTAIEHGTGTAETPGAKAAAA
ncbi:MAG: TAXI family TRAP transporter solute-binding subunit [Xanthobacteraceae bacterium]